jgi:hypothetical protein
MGEVMTIEELGDWQSPGELIARVTILHAKDRWNAGATWSTVREECRTAYRRALADHPGLLDAWAEEEYWTYILDSLDIMEAYSRS